MLDFFLLMQISNPTTAENTQATGNPEISEIQTCDFLSLSRCVTQVHVNSH